MRDVPFFPLPDDFAHVPFGAVLSQVQGAMIATGVPLWPIDGLRSLDEGSPIFLHDRIKQWRYRTSQSVIGDGPGSAWRCKRRSIDPESRWARSDGTAAVRVRKCAWRPGRSVVLPFVRGGQSIRANRLVICPLVVVLCPARHRIC
jgi:hypothetical protein